MVQEIAISVKNKIAETTFSEVVSFNSVYRLKFSLDDEWNEFPSRVAVVMWAGGAAEKLFTGTECEMPQVTSLGADTVLIGVYSRLGEKRIASSFVRLRCEAGAGGFPQPKPTATLHEQVLSFLNQKDWDIFADKVAEGVYSAVRVNKKGLVTEGKKIVEVSKSGSGIPSDLAAGGILFRLNGSVYVPYYYNGSSLEELKFSAGGGGGSMGHSLQIGDQTFDGTEDITVELGSLAGKDMVGTDDLEAGCVTSGEIAAGSVVRTHLTNKCVNADKLDDGAVQTAKLSDKAVTGGKLADNAVKAGEHVSVTKDADGFVVAADSSVFSVNGMKGDVVLDQDTLGLSDLAYSGNYRDLVGAPDSGVYSVNGQTGKVWLDKETLGLADVAISGSYNDLKDKPTSVGGGGAVSSVNGQTGEVTISADSLGLGSLAMKDTVSSDDLEAACITAAELAAGSVVRAHLTKKCVNAEKLDDGAVQTAKLADKAVTGGKLDDNAVKAGANISVTRDGENNFVIATALTTGVTSVNGKTGDVTVDKQSLGLGDLLTLTDKSDESADFNEMLSGAYCVVGTTSKPCTHFPVSLDNSSGTDCVWFVLAISTADRSRCAQFALSGKADRTVCIRSLSGGAWTTWKTVGA